MTVSVSELKAHLSEILRKVKGGCDVVVTERGRPIARLSPLPDQDRATARVRDLIESGHVRPGRGALPASFVRATLPADPEAATREALIDERRSGR